MGRFRAEEIRVGVQGLPQVAVLVKYPFLQTETPEWLSRRIAEQADHLSKP